jgi:hypothetical protein
MLTVVRPAPIARMSATSTQTSRLARLTAAPKLSKLYAAD